MGRPRGTTRRRLTLEFSPVRRCVGPLPRKAKYRAGYFRRQGCFGRALPKGENERSFVSPRRHCIRNLATPDATAACGPTSCPHASSVSTYRSGNRCPRQDRHSKVLSRCLRHGSPSFLLHVLPVVGKVRRGVTSTAVPCTMNHAAHPFRMPASLMPLPLCLKRSRRMYQIRGRQHAGRDREY